MTSLLPPGATGELDALRRRAYGPDADIDDVALARLRELEHQSAAISAPAALIPVEAPAQHAAGPHESDDAPVDTPPSVDAPVAAPVERTSRPLWRRPATWIAAASVAAVVAVAGVATATSSRPDSTLAPMADTVSFPENLQWLPRALGIPRDRLSAFDGPGEVTVWAGTAKDGVGCVLVMVFDGPFGFGCSRDDPTADIVLEERMASVKITGYPPRTTMRFVYTAGRVEVWVDEPEP